MHQSTHPAAFNRGFADLIIELFGDQAKQVICHHTSIGPGTAHRRLTGESDWLLREIILIADMIGVQPSRIVSAVTQVTNYGADLGQTAIGLARTAQAGR